ncbi:uncharacterized protein [Ptychodera flava]|uniref:uncharacterized protein n=1 Tax=Ptychodera flava TaxID=63121 RepID=UPI00396A75FE
MASKRSLYKPAPVENVGEKQARRPLSQGRLTTKPTLPDTLTVYASPSFLAQSVSSGAGDVSVTISHEPVDNLLYSPRQSLGELKKVTPALSADPAASPRSKLPTTSYIDPSCVDDMTRSPSRPQPEKVLELSDSDEDSSHRRRSPFKHVSHTSPVSVQLIDASGGRRDPNTSEVHIRTDVIESPAKVVCHSPAVVESDLRNTGYTQQSAKVPVDMPQTFSLLGDEDFTEVTHRESQREKPPLIVREKGITVTKAHQSDVSRKKVLRETNGDAGILEGLSGLPDDLLNDLLDGRDENAAGSANSTLSSIRDSIGDGREIVKKKKKSKRRVIQSRYMQSLQTTLPSKPNVSISGKNLDTTIATKSNTSQKTSKTSQKRSGGPRVHSHRTTPSDIGITPVTSHYGTKSTYTKRIIATSTPSTSVLGTGTPDVPRMVLGNESSIAPVSTIRMSKSKSKSKTAGVRAVSSLPTPDLPNVSEVALAEMTAALDMEVPDDDITQEWLDILYARYIQWVFMASKMKKVRQDQEKEASAQIYWLWNENDKLLQRKAELELEQAQLDQSNNLDRQLELQQNGLGPVVAGLEQLKQEHNTLAQAIDTTRHHVPMQGIHIPPNERDYIEQMRSALNETEQLLGEISVLTREKQPKANEMAKSMQILSNATENECLELDKLNEVLAAVKSLTTHETSLKIQQINRSDMAMDSVREL